MQGHGGKHLLIMLEVGGYNSSPKLRKAATFLVMCTTKAEPNREPRIEKQADYINHSSERQTKGPWFSQTVHLLVNPSVETRFALKKRFLGLLT